MSSTTGAFNKYVEMGFCIRPAAVGTVTATNKWECQQVRTQIDPESTDTAIYPKQFDLVDMYWTSATVPTTIPTAFVEDTDFATFDDQSLNWKSVPEKNKKDTCSTISPTATTYWCKELNSHFVRNWATSAATATPADQDLQITAEMKSFDVFGWMSSYTKAEYTGTPLTPRIGSMKSILLDFPSYSVQKAADIEAARVFELKQSEIKAQAAQEAAALAKL